jgi:hypothetical protein
MANNLHISYDLNAPGQGYSEVIEAIKSLGNWAKIHKSYWYVNSSKTASEALNIVWAKCDPNDTLYIADCTNNVAVWQNIPDDSSKFIKDQWLK